MMAEGEELGELISTVMRGHGAMTSTQIAIAVQRSTGVKTDARAVTKILRGQPRHFRPSHRRFFQRGVKWELVEVGSADSPGAAGAPVPARPYPPTLSGAAAADVPFREDEPPTNAIGRTA
jgi:hypothetical protein